MSRLAARAEVDKLARSLRAAPADLDFLHGLPAESLRSLRLSVYETLFAIDRPLFQRAVRLIRFLPLWLVAWIARWAGPVLTARVAGDMPARRAAQMAGRLPPEFVADVCAHLDPRRAPDLIRALPTPTIVPIALELLRRRDWLTTGRFVDFLSDAAIRAVLVEIDDDETLLRIAYYVESRNRLDHVVRLLPPERLRNAILLAVDESRDLLAEVMSLITHVSYALKRELGDLAAAQDDAVLNRVVAFAQQQGLWADLLPVISVLSADSQRKVVNLPVLREDPAVLETILATAHAHALWADVLPLVRFMNAQMREAVASITASLPPGALEGAAHAALMGEHWDALLDIATRAPPSKRAELASIVHRLGEVDPELYQRIRRRADTLGIGAAFAGVASRDPAPA